MSSANPTLTTQVTAITGLLGSHRVLKFAGPDAATFLQGYLTCDTDKLDPHNALPGAFTNLKGRVVANGWVWGSASEVQMLVSRDLTDTCAEFLKMYLNFAKTKLEIQPEPPLAHLNTRETTSTASDLKSAVSVGAGKWLLASGAQTEDMSSAWLAHTIRHNEALVTQATSGSLLPQMLGLTELGAVSFEKGCYLGQEVVARAQHRGEVKRRLQNISYVSEAVLPAGATVDDEAGKRVAVVINATAVPSNESASALVVSSVDKLAGAQLHYNGTPVSVAS